MTRSIFDKIFDPQSVAVIGASDKEGSVGFTLMRNLTKLGYEGGVYPVNIRGTEILGFKVYPSMAELPEIVDLAIIATPARTVPQVLEECGSHGVKGVVIISAGFREIGPEGQALEREILNIKDMHKMRIVGPNCLGIIRPSIRLNATFLNRMPDPGNIAFISQSGALGSAIFDWALKENVGFSHFVSLGSMIDIDFGDLIDYFGTDPKTESILMYIEGITDAKRFMSAARHFSKTKPIIVAKSGRFLESAKAAASHTGSLSGEDMIYDAAFKRAGLIRVDEIADLFNSAAVLAKQPLPKGPRLAIITNAGGPGVMATDALIANNGELAKLSPRTVEVLDGVLPHYWSRGNPIDILGDAKADRIRPVIEACIEDEEIDGLLIIYTAQAIGEAGDIARNIAEIYQKTSFEKTILASFMGGEAVKEANDILAKHGIPTFYTPEQAVKTYLYMHKYKRNLELLYETPQEIASNISSPKLPVLSLLKDIADEDREILTEEEAKILLTHCNLPVVRTQIARTKEEAALLAAEIGYPIVLKILSPQITHKTDAGGVILDINSEADLFESFELIIKRAKEYDPDADILGVTVQPMIKKKGYEVIVGAKQDPVFGPVVLFGMGGIGVEVFNDVAIGLPPLNRALAKRIMEETKVYKLLTGYRNLPPVNLRLLEEILVRFSQMLIDFPQLKEVDINPLFLDENEAFALDARIVIDRKKVCSRIEPHQHLVISPYPSKYENICKLRDGRKVFLRPMKPEDEAIWLEMFENLSEESRKRRFFKIICDTSQETKIGYCHIDYDREISFVGEMAEEGRRKIIGAIRLLMEANGKTGEIAIIVADSWQKQGLGSNMLNYLIEICKDKKIEEIYGVTQPDNNRAITLVKKRGFTTEPLEDGTLKATLKLHP